MKAYILKGEDADKVIRENRFRINRGKISITPVDTDLDPCNLAPRFESDNKYTPIIDDKYTSAAEIKEITPKKRTKKSE